MDKYRRWLERPGGMVHRYEDVDRGVVREVLERAEQAGRSRLSEGDALSILEAYRIPVVAWHVAGTADEAVEAARAIGFPVVLKVMAPDISQKSDVGGVIVGLDSDREVRTVLRAMRWRACWFRRW